MRFVKVLALILAPALSGIAAPERESFDLDVTRVRLLRNQPGNLHIDAHGVVFRSNDGKTTITIALKDLREADVADVRALRFGTYEVRKWMLIERLEYTFRAQPDAPIGDLARFLAAHVHRPVVGHYPEAPRFQVAAYHRRVRGGANGMLEIGEEAIQFASDQPA